MFIKFHYAFSTLIPVLRQGDLATEAIMDYLSLMRVLEQVKNLSNETGTVLHYVMNQSLSFLDNSYTLHDSLLLSTSYQLMSSTQELSSDIPDLLASIDGAKMQELHLARNSARLNDVVTQLSLDIASLNMASTYTMSDINQTLSQVGGQITSTQDGSAKLRLLLPSLLDETSAVSTGLNDSQAVSTRKMMYDIYNLNYLHRFLTAPD